MNFKFLIKLIGFFKPSQKYKIDAEEKLIILGQFESLKEDWEAPGMEIYDDLKKTDKFKTDEFEKSELSNSEEIEKKGAAKALLDLAHEMEKELSKDSNNSKKDISRNYKKYLYGKNGILN